MIRYAVVRSGVEWCVVSERRRIGRFDTSEAAVRLCLKLCREAADNGHEIELSIQDAAGQLQRMPLPPKPATGAKTRSPGL